MSLCLMNVHGDIEGDYEFVCDIPNGTNGEVIKEIYRHNSDMNCGSNGEYIHIWSNDGKCQMTIHKDWWNAPYQKGGE